MIVYVVIAGFDYESAGIECLGVFSDKETADKIAADLPAINKGRSYHFDWVDVHESSFVLPDNSARA